MKSVLGVIDFGVSDVSKNNRHIQDPPKFPPSCDSRLDPSPVALSSHAKGPQRYPLDSMKLLEHQP